jgi:hypothetical protein
MHSAEGRVQGVRYLLPSIQRLRDKFERAAVATELAHQLGIDKVYLLEQVRGMGGDRREEAARVPSADIAATERLLLRSLLVSDETRQAVLPQLDLEQLPVAVSTKNILQALKSSRDGFDYGAVEARLEESDRRLLTSLIFADEGGNDQQQSTDGPEAEAAQAHACLEKLYADGAERGRAAMKQRIREAEQRGDVGEAIELSRQLAEMESRGQYRRRRSVE